MVSYEVVPVGMFKGALFLLAVGFPVILATAWVQTPPLEDAEGVGGKGSGRNDPASEMARAGSNRTAGLVRLLTWRNAVLGGVAAFALLGLLTAGSTVMQVAGIGGDRAELEPDRIAVLPFGIRGSSDLDYLGEGIVDLVSARLDGAGSLTTVDPRAVIAGAAAPGVDLSVPGAADRLAAGLRAGRFVTGDLTEVSGRVRLTAHLYETGRPDRPSRQATAEGAAEDIFALLDGLVGGLLAEMLAGEGDRRQGLATLTTGSLHAAKEYLWGEQLLRGGRYREAAAAYDGAITLDSTFALAHYRKSIAADWTDAPDIRSSAEHAMRFADRLSAGDRGLLEAVRLRRNGRIEDAEQAFRTRLHADPDDVEALVQYGELLFHDVARRGRSIRESMRPFRRALELEPSNLIAHVHLARLYALADSADRLAETARRIGELAPESERSIEVLALYAHATRDTARQRAVREQLRGSEWYFWWYAVHGVHAFGRDPAGAAEILAARDSDAPFLEALGVNLDLIRGRHVAVRKFLARPSIQDGPTWNLFEAFLLTSGTLASDEGRMTNVAGKLAALESEEMLRSRWLPPYEDETPRLAEFERDYFRALLLIRLGRLSEAAALREGMAAQDEFVGLGTVKQDAERMLRAELLLQDDDRPGALEVLRSVEYEVPHSLTARPIADQSRSRLLRGELEMELGDRETAKVFLVGLDESGSVTDSFFRPQVYRHLGRIAEDAGRTDEAIAYYTRLIHLWADCDPELVPIRQEIEARRNALVRATG